MTGLLCAHDQPWTTCATCNRARPPCTCTTCRAVEAALPPSPAELPPGPSYSIDDLLEDP